MLSKIKKYPSKVIKKIKRVPEELPLRITNETVAEHREQILAGGRKFKYPLQYAKHKLVYNAAIISVVALGALAVFGWWQLYPMQASNSFFYNVTKVLPLPVAVVDGEWVSYRDYLMKYRSAIYYLENKEQVTPDDRQISYVKQQAMSDAVADAYARKMAAQLKISISDEELNDFLKLQRQSADGEVSKQTYDAVIADYYDWSADEYSYAMRSNLLKIKVAYAVDDTATKMLEKMTPLAKASTDLKALAESFNKDSDRKVVYSDVGWVPRSNNDGGLAIEAAKLNKGAVSDVIKPTKGDGYYFVVLVDSSDTHVNYRYIKIPLSTFDSTVSAFDSGNKINYFITMPSKES